MRIKQTIETGALPLDRVVLALPALVRARSAWRFEDGTFVDEKGRRREGLRLEEGAHPAVGARYRIVTREAVVVDRSRPNPGGPFATSVQIQRDDDEAICVRVHDEPITEMTLDLELIRPAHPDRVDATMRLVLAPAGLGKRPFEGRATATFADLDATDRTAVLVDGHVRHWSSVANATLTIQRTPKGTVSISLDLRVRGRWLLRPVVAFVGVFVAVLGREGRDKIATDLTRNIDLWGQRLLDELGPEPDPDAIAHHVLDDLIDHVAVTVPTE